ncbi:MAG: ABC transporter ATP-binding protein [Desulfosalsimonadaceae bacterium]
MYFARGLKNPVHALRGLTLNIKPGSIVGLLGPNGCGKTTAISCLTGFLYPQSGNILLFNEPVAKAVTRTWRNPIGIVMEDTRLPPYLTVKTALVSVCRLRNISSSQISKEMDRIIEEAGINQFLSLRISGLSKGQARRVGVAAAMVSDPPLLIMDEPASGMDVSSREEFNNLIRQLKNGRRTILITSHLLIDVENTCSHIAIMQDGCIKVYDETQRLISSKNENDIDIFIHENHADNLQKLGLNFSTSKYSGLIMLTPTDIPAHQTLGLLSEHQIVPQRITPRADLIRYYLEVTENKDQS